MCLKVSEGVAFQKTNSIASNFSNILLGNEVSSRHHWANHQMPRKANEQNSLLMFKTFFKSPVAGMLLYKCILTLWVWMILLMILESWFFRNMPSLRWIASPAKRTRTELPTSKTFWKTFPVSSLEFESCSRVMFSITIILGSYHCSLTVILARNRWE
jgi:hypothetical protein